MRRFVRAAVARAAATAVVGAAFVVASPATITHAAPTTYTVTNTSSNSLTSGSLPWAVHQANYTTPGLDKIKFNIPGNGPHTITLSGSLYLNDQIVIEGNSEPGWTAQAPMIWVEGGANVPSLFVLQNDPSTGRTSSGSTIMGLGMVRYTSNAITIFPGSIGNWIQQNLIGFRPNGGSVTRNTGTGLPNVGTSRGIGIASSWNVVRWNTISGVDNAITIGDPTMNGAPFKTNSIRENNIGTDPTGTITAGYGNLGDGIFLGEGASENFLGPANIISGNGSAGVEFFHSSNRGNVVFRNYIGLDTTGKVKLGNGEVGVLFTRGATYNAIGGPFGGNFIAGNTYGGISLGQSTWGASSGNWIQNNTIGLNTDGVVMGGQQVGVSLNSGSKNNLVSNNVIGGHSQHAVIIGDPSGKGSISNAVNDNYLGRTVSGDLVPNGGFAVMFLNAGYNYMYDNKLGTNTLGPYGVVNSPGLAIRLL